MESLLRSVYGRAEAEYVIKKSRFIATVCEVKTEEAAAAFIESVRKHYWDARHNCSAFQIGAGGQIQRSSDDGEPSGTAGRPILEVLKKRDLTNTAVVVTRYFGGVLLGTGGLVRAYQGLVKLGLETLPVTERVPSDLLKFTLEHPFVNIALREFENHQARILEKDFAMDATFTVSVPQSQAENLINTLTEKTSGGLLIEKIQG